MKNLCRVLLILAVLVVICEPVWAQTPAGVAAAAQQLGRALPLVPSAAAGHYRPHIWVRAALGARGQGFSPQLPSFCNRAIPGLCTYLFCPNAMVAAYGVNQIVGANGGQGMTIAIVDAFHYAGAEADLNQFSSDMGLQGCTSVSGCFSQVNQVGGAPRAGGNAGWELETMLDIEWAHAMAPKAHILLVEGDTNSFADLAAALTYASMNADIVSNSYGATEWDTETALDPVYAVSTVPLLFSSGDAGQPAIYPCQSPYTTCIGGTRLLVNASFQRTSESGWSGSGGGCSLYELAQTWQAGFTTCSMRAAPDVSADADPDTGVAVLDNGNGGYYLVGGTSLSCPMTAAIFADVMTARVSFGKAKFGFMNPVLYAAATRNYPYFYFDVTAGNNGFAAGPGYDLVTGLGVSKGPAMANRFFGLIYNPVPF